MIRELLVCLGVGTLGGVLSGMLGLGGAALLPPLLGWGLGISQHLAQGISLAALLPPVGIPAVAAYRRHGVVFDWPFIAWMIAGFMVGAACGGWLAHSIPDAPLRRLFGLFMLATAWQAWRKSTQAVAPRLVQAKPHHWQGMAIGSLAGLLSGLLGVGGGMVAVPLLRRWAHYGRLEAQATTLAMMLPPIALPAVLVYAHQQEGLPWLLLGAVAVGFASGTGLGGLWAGRLPQQGAERFYALALGSLAFLVLVRQ